MALSAPKSLNKLEVTTSIFLRTLVVTSITANWQPKRVWAAFNKAMGIGSMRMLPLNKFTRGEAYLLEWIGRLNSTASVESKDYEESKKRKLTYIRVNMRKLPIEDRVKSYMQANYGVESTKDLPDLYAIKKVYYYVASLKKALAAK